MENDELRRKITGLKALLKYLVIKIVDLKIKSVRRESNNGECSQKIEKKFPLKLEVNFDLNSYRGRETNVEKLNQWFKQLKVFFRV